MNSGWKISLSIILWIVVFAVIYSINEYGWVFHFTLDWESLSHSAISFFMGEPSAIFSDRLTGNGNTWFRIITLGEQILAYLHLGIFIAYLYQKLSRK